MRLHSALDISRSVRKTSWPEGHYYKFMSAPDLTGCHFLVIGTEQVRAVIPLDWIMDENWEPVAES